MTTPSLTKFPVAVRAEWRSKTVTTDPPRLTPHEEWRLDIRLVADAPFRRVALMYRSDRLEWGLSRDPASVRVEASLHFSPFNWSSSDEVQVSFDFRRVNVTDAKLKEDPRPELLQLLPETASTGQIIAIGEIPRHELKIAVLPIAEEDIEPRRMDRWRLRPELADSVAPELRQLAGGHQTGVREDYAGTDSPAGT